MFYRPHKRVTLNTGDVMVTKQSHKAECDIHNVVNQYKRTGIVSHISKARAQYEVLPDPMEYQEALNIQLQAEEAFGALPASVRDAFGNEPLNLLRALGDEKRHEELRSLGILKAKEAPPAPPEPSPPST